MSDLERFAGLPYRPCVGIMLLNDRSEIFAGRRISELLKEPWQMPQGGIDDGEDARTAAFRELKEEIGTNSAEVLAETADWLTYDLPPELLGKALRGKFRGQRQRWFAMRFIGADSDIDLDTDHPEFDAWAWMRPGDLLARIVPFKRDVYERVFDEFKHLTA